MGALGNPFKRKHRRDSAPESALSYTPFRSNFRWKQG